MGVDELPILAIDGARFDDLNGFYREVSDRIIPGTVRVSNLDSFNDILRGGFGTPDGGFHLVWKNSELSRQSLGWDETVRYLERKLTTCHRDNLPLVQIEIEAARSHQGQTLFEMIVEVIQVHVAGGPEAEDGVVLTLE